MKAKLFIGIAGLAMVMGGLTGFGTGIAAADSSTPIPTKDNSAGLYTPPNCEWTVEGLDCDLPPECEYVTVDGGGIFQVTSIECDIDPACELQTGEFLGTTFWFI